MESDETRGLAMMQGLHNITYGRMSRTTARAIEPLCLTNTAEEQGRNRVWLAKEQDSQRLGGTNTQKTMLETLQ